MADMLNLMLSKRIFDVSKTEEGLFRVTECCDEWFSMDLTAEQLKQLGEELIEFAKTEKESTNDQRP